MGYELPITISEGDFSDPASGLGTTPLAKIAVRFGVCDYGGFLELRMAGKNVFDFAGFDAEAADFDLLVNAAKEFELSVRAVVGKVAGFVETLVG